MAQQDEAIRPEALEVLRSMIEKVIVTPQSGATLLVELHGDIARLIAITAAGGEPKKAKRPASGEAGRSVLSVVAGARNRLCRTICRRHAADEWTPRLQI
jgi:hypothetical protein